MKQVRGLGEQVRGLEEAKRGLEEDKQGLERAVEAAYEERGKVEEEAMRAAVDSAGMVAAAEKVRGRVRILV